MCIVQIIFKLILFYNHLKTRVYKRKFIVVIDMYKYKQFLKTKK